MKASQAFQPRNRKCQLDEIVGIVKRAGQIPMLLLIHASLLTSQTPALHQAVLQSHTSTVEALINEGVDINGRDRDGRTPLQVAATVGGPEKLEVIRLLLAKGANPNLRDNSGTSPLDEAVWKGWTERAALLLEGGASIDAPESKTGASPLNEAAFQGHIGVVKLLIARGADARIRDHNGFLPIENAVRENHPEVISLLLGPHPNPDLLQHLLEDAIRRHQHEIAAILLDAGAPIDGPFSSGSTPLYEAALKGDAGIVSLLLARGANVNSRDANSLTTPLYAAAAFGRQDVVTTLLLWGADPALTGKEGGTPRHAAESNGFRKIAEQLRIAEGAAVARN